MYVCNKGNCGQMFRPFGAHQHSSTDDELPRPTSIYQLVNNICFEKQYIRAMISSFKIAETSLKVT